MKKKIGYWCYAIFFYLFRLCPVRKNKVFCVMTHDGSPGSSVGVVVEALKKQSSDYEFVYMRKEDREGAKNSLFHSFLSFFLVKPYHMATASYIMLDNIFLPMAYLRFSKKVKVIQLWHGTGTIKKFGQDVNKGQLKKLEYQANQKITHLIVNSNYTRKQYAKAFGVDKKKVCVWGLPRTDEMFSDEIKEDKKKKFYERYPQLMGKRLVLYAPTFRDQEVAEPKMKLDLDYLEKHIDHDTIFLVKLHPFVASRFNMKESEHFVNVSTYSDINTLLFVSDILITDYSSIIFEYCVLEKPMVFFAYDLEQFSESGRGFYEDYATYVPGPVVKDSEELAKIIMENDFPIDRVKAFKEQSFAYLDGKSTERLLNRIFEA